MENEQDCWEQKIVSMYYRTVFSVNNIWLILLGAILFSCTSTEESLPYYNTPDFTPIFIQNKKNVSDSITHHIGNFSLTNQDSVTITEKDIEGKIHIANFIFTSCGSICPVMTTNLQTVGIYFKNDNDIVLLSFSVTPWIDGVSRLKSYKENNCITNKNWHFLTGNQSDIYALARTSYFAEEDLGFTKDSTEFLHTEHVLLIDKTKRIRGIYNGTLKLEMNQLIKDTETLKKE